MCKTRMRKMGERGGEQQGFLSLGFIQFPLKLKQEIRIYNNTAYIYTLFHIIYFYTRGILCKFSCTKIKCSPFRLSMQRVSTVHQCDVVSIAVWLSTIISEFLVLDSNIQESSMWCLQHQKIKIIYSDKLQVWTIKVFDSIRLLA